MGKECREWSVDLWKGGGEGMVRELGTQELGTSCSQRQRAGMS